MPINIGLHVHSVLQSVCGGSGFYVSDSSKEKYVETRKIVLRSKATREFIDDFSSGKGTDPDRGVAWNR